MNLENLIKYYFKKDLYTLLLYPNNTFSLLLYGDNYDFLSLQSKKKLANSKKYSQKFNVKSKSSNEDDEDFHNEDLDIKKKIIYEEGLYIPNQIYIRRSKKNINNKKNKRRNKNKHTPKELYQLHLKQHNQNVYKFRPLVKLTKQVSYILKLAIDNHLKVLKEKLHNVESSISTHHLEYSKWYLPSSKALDKVENLNTSAINLIKENTENSIKENDQKILQFLSIYLFYMFTYKKRVSEFIKKSNKLSPLVAEQKVKYDTIFDLAYVQKRQHLYWPKLNYTFHQKSLKTNKDNDSLFYLERLNRIKEFETYFETHVNSKAKKKSKIPKKVEDHAKTYIKLCKMQVKTTTERSQELNKITASINMNKYQKLVDLIGEARKWKVGIHPLIRKAIVEKKKLTRTERKLIQIIRQRIIDAKKIYGNKMKTREERFRNPSILSRIQDFKNKLENLQLLPINGTSLKIQHILHNNNSWWIITNVDNNHIQSLTDSTTTLGRSHIKTENKDFPLYSLLTEKDLSRYLVSVFSSILRWNGKKKAGESRKSKFQDPLFLSQMLLKQELKELPKAFKINGISIKLSGRLYKSRLTLSEILSEGYVYENDFRYLSKSAYRTRASLIGLKLKTSTSLPREIK